MSPHLPLPLEELGETARERLLLGRLGLVIAAIVMGAGSGWAVHAWADTRIGAVEARLKAHLEEMERLRPEMKETVTKLESKLDLLIEDCYRRGGCKR